MNTIAFGGIGTPELVIILVIVLMLFGVGKLPEVARMLGSGAKNFRDGLSGKDDKPEETAEDSKPELIEDKKVEETATASKAEMPAKEHADPIS